MYRNGNQGGKEMNHQGTKQLETERLILRKFKVEDADAMFHNWASSDEVTKFLTWPSHESVEVTKYLLNDWIPRYNKSDYYNWVIELKETGEIVGNISVVQINENIKEASLGYCMGENWWGQGIMPEAGKAVINYLFNEIGFNRIEAYHDKNNPKSGRVMQKLGMIYEGVRRKKGINNQGIIDDVVYAILWEDYQQSCIRLVKATKLDAELLHRLQIEAFMPLYKKYHDDDTNPAKESKERILQKVEDTDFFIIYHGEEPVGGIRVKEDYEEEKVKWISPLFIVPQWQNKGFAQEAIRMVFERYKRTDTWRLATIKQEIGNCYLYEKLGFERDGFEQIVNEKMTLVGYCKSENI